MFSRHPALIAAGFVLALAAAGCSHPAAWIDRPDFYAPPGALASGAVAGYDTDGNGRADYLQVYNAQGVKRRFLFDTSGDGTMDLAVDLDHPDAAAVKPPRTLLFLLDGISYDVVADLWKQGHFRLFYPPGRVIGGLPTVTDNIYADFFETPRPFGYEALYVDRLTGKLSGGNLFYLQGGNERVWPDHVLWRQHYLFDGLVYGLPDWVAGRELDKSVGAILAWLEKSDSPYALQYIVSTDALGHKLGHEKLREFLIRFDVALEKIFWQSRGQLRLLTMADHGLNQASMKRVPLVAALEQGGFHLTEELKADNDVIIPDFGLVSCAAVYARQPIRAAECLAKVEGVALAFYPEAGAFVVLEAEGRARVETRADGGYRYVAERGDPLRLLPIMEKMKGQGLADIDGWADAKAWLDATWNHEYPDPLVRIAHAFEGNVIHPPDVMLAFRPDYFYGEDGFDKWATLRGTHGSLHRDATTTYVLSNFFVPAEYQRTTELREDLKKMLGRSTLLPDEKHRP